MSLAVINSKYFGKDPSKQYLITAVRKATEKLIALELVLRMHDEILKNHICLNTDTVIADCSYCNLLYVLVDAYMDAVFLSARLIFSNNHSTLAADFIVDIKALKDDDIKVYYEEKYDHKIMDMSALLDLQKLAASTEKELVLKYKSIDSYQKYKFHQPASQVVADVSTRLEKGEGGFTLKSVKKAPKQPNSTNDVLDMLIGLSGLMHRYTHLASLPCVQWSVPVERMAIATEKLFGVRIEEEKMSSIVAETEVFIKPINEMLNCGAGLRYSNILFMQKMQKSSNTEGVNS